MAETNVTANPPNNGGINVNELSSNIIIFVNCAIIGYSEIKTILFKKYRKEKDQEMVSE